MNYDEERKIFFDIVSHELRTPVYGINGLATMIESEQDPDERQRYFASLKHTAQHISMFVDNILQGSKYSFDERKLNMTPVNIRIKMENIYNSIHVFVKEKSLEFKHKLSIHSDSLIILLDKVALNQIIINLIYNAIKNSDYGKVISFDVSEISRTTDKVALQFDIIDEGRGLRYAEDISEFTLYEKQKNLKHFQSERGLGLIIVQQLLKYYNSELFVKSVLNKGTHFRFTLLLPIYQASQRTYHEPAQVQTVNQEKRILVVDDNPLNLLISRKTVEKISPFIKVTTADSGAKAIDLFKYINFDLVLMDLNMPDKDGFETTLDLKALNKFIPVVALTALSYDNVIGRAKEVGMEDVITKPYNLEAFEKIIRYYLNPNIKKS
ncbi:response regulator [Niabella ginsengisoli]|uniref:histidine kinase n=1 Tax=Niabella ginsengisoli TaxID=522298 RepID=A0ABS9SRF9_9BACT|nr:response regulator [Niabella ginsengisoli]MCH5600709.1 response regulator [Niabella ginsengisoli]